HQLVSVGDGTAVRAEEFDTIVNRPIVERSAFVLLLAAYLPAIAPVYGNDAMRFAILEAGAMTQLLRDAAAEHNLSLCMIGDAATETLRAAAALSDGEQVVAMIAGGVRDDAEQAATITSSAPSGVVTPAILNDPAGAKPDASLRREAQGWLPLAPAQ